MRQVTQKQGEGKIRVVEVPPPALRPGGVLVRTAFSLISAGTERAKLELAQRSLAGKAMARPEQARQVWEAVWRQGPLATWRKVSNRLEALEPLGYSCSGVVLARGEGAEDLQPGDRVACAGAGYANHAEIVFVPRNLCVKVPGAEGGMPGVSLEEAAFATVGAIAMQGVRQAEARVGELIGVVGLGLIGLLTVGILKAAGCRVLGLDPDPARRRVARELGAEAAEAPDAPAALELAGARFGLPGCDAVILTAATASDGPVRLAGRLCRDRGRVVVVGNVGMDLPRGLYYEKELELRLSRSYGPGRYDPDYEEKGRDYPIGYVRWTERRNMEAFLALIAEGRLELRRLITHRFEIGQAEQAYRLISSGEPHLGVLLEYPRRAEAGQARVIAVAPRRPRAPAAGERVAIGLIGAGHFAQDVLIPALKASGRARLRAVATASGLTARSVAERFGFERAAAGAEPILEDPEIQAVVIATRHDAHARLAIEALRAGKHVFLEKPPATNAEQLEELAAACRAQAGARLLMVGFNRRFAPAVKAVGEFLAASAEPRAMHYRVNAGYLPAGHWLHDPESGGGRIVGEGCHFVDLLMVLAGGPPVEVFARALPDLGRYRQDNVAALVAFADGSLGSLHYLANGDRGAGKEFLEISSGGATAAIEDFRRTTLRRGGRVRRLGSWWRGPDKGHRAEIEAFLQAVLQGGPSPIALEEMLCSMRATLAVRESLRLGRPVRLGAAEEAGRAAAHV